MSDHCCGHQHHHAPETIRDPVCGMTVDPVVGKPTHAHEGRVFHFCNPGCRDKFEAAVKHFEAALAARKD